MSVPCDLDWDMQRYHPTGHGHTGLTFSDRRELVWTPDIDVSRDHIQRPGYFYGNWWWSNDSCTSTLRIPGIVSYYTYLTLKLLPGVKTQRYTINIVLQSCGFQIVYSRIQSSSTVCQWKDRKLHFRVKTIICLGWGSGWTQSSVES